MLQEKKTMTEELASDFSIGSMLRLMWRHKFKLALMPPIIVGLGVAAILFLPRTYQSQARLFLQVGHEAMGVDPTVSTGDTITLSQSSREVEVNSAMDVLKSRNLAALVVDRLGPEAVLKGPKGPGGAKEPPAFILAAKRAMGAAIDTVRSIDPITDRERAIIQLEKNLEIDAERESMVISLAYEADSAKGAQQVLATLIDLYDDEYLRIHRNAASGQFFEGQLELLKKQLDLAVNNLNATKNKLGLVSVEARRNSLESQLQSVELSTYEAEQEKATATARVKQLTSQVGDMPERLVSSRKSIPNAGADLLREQLYALQVKQMDLKARYNENHPLVAAVADQVREAKRVVDTQSTKREETTDDVNPVHRDLSLQLKQQETIAAGFEARLAMLREQKELVLNDLKELNSNAIQIDQLERAETLARTKYFQYAENFEQSRIDSELERNRISSVSVVQPATYQEKPVSPSKLILGAGSIILALTAPVTLILLSERLRKLRTLIAETRREMALEGLGSLPETEVYRGPRPMGRVPAAGGEPLARG